MKTLADLEAIRKKAFLDVNMRKDSHAIKIVVGMGTCGIEAGARAVMSTLMQELAKAEPEHVAIMQKGCVGLCAMEPIVEVLVPDEKKVVYVKVTPEKAVRIVKEHIINGNPIKEYTIEEAE